MRGFTVHTTSPMREMRGAMRRSKAARIIFVLACCLLLTACPSSGGDLKPVPVNGGEVIANDTLRVTREQVTVSARGLWRVSDSETSITLEIANANAEPLMIDFDKCELVNDVSKERLSLRAVSEYKGKSDAAFISDRLVTIDGGSVKKFDAVFFIKADGGRSSVTRNVEGQMVTLRFPVTVKRDAPAQADFAFTFMYRAANV